MLERERDGWTLVEVKSTVETKTEHVPDVAIQLFVARAAGLHARRVEVMHLNRSCRAPDVSNLFARDDVIALAEAFQPEIPQHVERMHDALAAPVPPAVAPRVDCEHPNDCPFLARCHPELPEHHVSTLYRVTRRQLDALLAAGIETIDRFPPEHDLGARAARQVRSVRSNRLVLERGLAAAVRALALPAAYLDFETIAPPVPVWDGCGPYDAVPVQLSCHVARSDGTTVHHAHLVEPGGDPQPAVVAACGDARTVVAYAA